MKKVLLAGILSMMAASYVQAADIEAPMAYDWTGPYIGLQAGYGWGETDVHVKQEPQDTSTDALARSVNAITLFPLSDGSVDADGFIGGAHLGYNYQTGSLVLGLEGDLEYADMTGKTDIYIRPTDDERVGYGRKDIDWLASLRLRAGLALDRALVYATGGLAVGGIEMTAHVPDFDIDASESETAWGWTIGAGLEYAFTDALSGRIEYRYTDLENTKAEIADLGSINVENDFHAIRAGLSWHF